jgi:hypothetical protein
MHNVILAKFVYTGSSTVAAEWVFDREPASEEAALAYCKRLFLTEMSEAITHESSDAEVNILWEANRYDTRFEFELETHEVAHWPDR